ncbi:aldo/keto reductase [Cupriavidus sp. CV2]|uniref:aldo/keto reductase n=1 Tax=Cupriavidus ulmosensis TaxID=3065913 RepID=UPI00296AAA5F|nr:aldo/keto reductase [Cupriavidus sp. CV2]MDW3680552.1 aldo/keto reductase [Cupriavidus sp. CV2]
MQTVSASGASIPSLGVGTYGMRGEELSGIVASALQSGFRHIDTAQMYANEADVGQGIAQSGVPRSEVFITTKVWVGNYAPRLFGPSVDDSLRKLHTDYIDLLLLHWPSQDVPLADQLGALSELVRVGKVRHIGVSNYNRALMAQAIALSERPLVTNQFEYHPYLDQRVLVTATRDAGLAVTAYCGMAVGRVFTDPVLKEIAARHQRGVSQIVLRWLVQQDGVIALSRTTRIDRLGENAAVFDFELSPDEMAAIFALVQPGSRIVDPPGLAPLWD